LFEKEREREQQQPPQLYAGAGARPMAGPAPRRLPIDAKRQVRWPGAHVCFGMPLLCFRASPA
jgi:hypothetical protein